MYELLLILHLLGFAFLMGGVGINMLSGIMMGKTDSPALLVMWSKVNHNGEFAGVIPGALVLLITGTLLVKELNYDFGAPWISAAYALWFVALFLGGHVLGSHVKKVRRAAEAELESGVERSETAAKLASSPIGPIFGNLLNVLVVVFIWLMVAKPG